MKKFFYLLLAMMLIGVSCEDSSKDVDSTPKGVVFADGTEMSAEFGSSGGSKSFSFSSDLDWEVTTSADWISVTPSSGTPSVKKFTVKASANDSFEERSGTVTMTTTDDRSYTIEVTQAAENETFTINGNGEYEVSATGGEVKVKVTTNLEYTVEIPAEAKAWLSVADTRAVREETLTFTVAENASFDERSATVELKGADGKVLQSIVFKQKGEEKVFDTDGEGNYVVEAAGGEVEVKVTTNLEYTVEIPAEAKAWLSVADTRAVREETLTFTVAKNETFDERSATVELKGADGKVLQSISFKQKGEEKVFDTDGEGNYVVEAVGGEVEVKVTTNLEYTVEIPAEAKAWLSVADTRVVREETLTFTVAKNETFDERSATVELKGADGEVLQSIVFKQKGEERVFDTDGEGNYVVEAAGGEVKVKVTTNLEYTVEIPAEAKAWLSVADTRAVIREETLAFTVAENASFDERSATVELKGADGKVLQSIVFKQKGEEKVFDTDGEGNYIVEAVGGEVEVKVTTNLEYTVEIPAEAKAWLSVADTRAVIREETLTFTVAKNETLDERSATVELKGADGKVLQSIVFKQKEYGGAIEVDEEYVVDAEGGELEVKLSTDIDFTTSIPEEAKSWISIVETRSMRNESLTFNIAINDDVKERSATINLQNAKGNDVASFVILQKGADALLELQNQYSISNMGGNFEVAVTTNLEYEVEISADATSWLSYVETRALRTDKLIFNATPNEGDAERSGTIKLIGEDNKELQVITVTQRGNIFGFAYTTNDGKPLNPHTTEGFGGEFKENIYDAATGHGVLKFAGAVTTIPEQAFAICENLTRIDIPEGITTIGKEAFIGCTALEELTIPSTLTSLDSSAFKNCSFKATINCDNVSFSGVGFTEVIIGDNVTTIGYRAFYDCGSLTSVTIGDSVTTIGDYAFGNCNSLTSVTIPDSVTTIGEWAFYDCYNLTSVTIPDSVTTIGANAFHECYSLTSVTIGNSVTTIGYMAFFDCNNLTSVTIGDSVTTIGDSAFHECYSLTSVTIPDSVTTIGPYAFKGCISLTSVYCEAITPPAGNIGMFDGTSATIYIPEGSLREYKMAEYWSEYADCFVEYDYNSTMTISYTTSDGMPVDAHAPIVSNSYQNGVGELIYIGKDIIPVGLFRNCDNLTSLTIPDSVTTIGDRAFSGCDSLTSVTIPNRVTTIGNSAFSGCRSLTSVTIPDSVTTIGNSAFSECRSLTSVTIPDSVTTIGKYAFSGCAGKAIINCNIPDRTSGNDYHDVFYGAKFTEVIIGDNVTRIGYGAFYECSSLTSVTIGDSVTTIGWHAFAYCESLTSVTIPNSVTTIGDEAFKSCSSLTSVYCEATTPPTLGGSYVFYYNKFGRKIYVPAESVEAYKAAKNWSNYASSIVGYNFE